MSATQQTLAQMIRSKHPGAYDDMDDQTLEKNVLAKYPQYGDLPRTADKPAPTYAPGREFGVDVAKGMGLDTDKIKAAEDKGGRQAAVGEIASQLYGGLTNFVSSVAKDPFNAVRPLHAMASALTTASGVPDTGSVFDPKQYHTPNVGQMVGATANILGGAESATKVGQARGKIGAAIHTSEGELTPGAELTGKVVGGAAGAAAGAAIGHEYLGAAAGYKLGPSLMDRIFPEPQTAAEAREQAAAYQAKAEDLMRRGREQEALDRKATASQRLKDKLAANAAKNAPQPSPFAGATPTSTPVGNESLPGVPQGSSTPFPQVQKLSELQQGQKSLIQSPESPAPPINKTYVSYGAKQLVELAKQGDLNAIRELIRNPRGINISDIPNVKYLMEPGRRGVVYGGPTG